MAKGKKSGGKNFEPGNMFGRGRPVLPEELKAVKLLTKDTYKRMFCKYLEYPIEELEQRIRDKTLPALEHVIAAAVLKAVQDGTIRQAIGDPLDRTIGPVEQNVNIEMPKPMIINNLDGSQLILGVTKPKGEDDVDPS